MSKDKKCPVCKAEDACPICKVVGFIIKPIRDFIKFVEKVGAVRGGCCGGYKEDDRKCCSKDKDKAE